MTRLITGGLLFVLTTTATVPAFADAPTLNIVAVSGRSATRLGTDAGIDLASGGAVRLTASGNIGLPIAGCTTSTPEGCARGFAARDAIDQPVGALVATFADRTGHQIGGWVGIGLANAIAIPAGATRLYLRVNGADARAVGTYKVVSDVIAGAPSSVNFAGVRRLIASTRVVSTGSIITRKVVQASLRRFGFADSRKYDGDLQDGSLQVVRAAA